MGYKFQPLLERGKEGHINGPMSPVLFMNGVAKQLGFNYQYLVRVDNNQSYDSGYDHLLAKWETKNHTYHCLVVDMGSQGIPVSLVIDGEATLTSIYQKQTTEEAMEEHRYQTEAPKRSKENPIMILTVSDIENMIKQAEAQNEFKIIEK